MLEVHRLAMVHRAVSHPKLDLLREVVQEQFKEKPGSLVIVFAQYRDTITTILHELEGLGVRPARFVGQASRKGERGLTQKEQKEVLEGFRRGEYNVLAASSVAEEGLDIPSVDLVVFYEPIPSEIRAIQRRGRTGRSDIGRVAVLITEETETRDEAYLYAEMAREKKMQRTVKWLGKRK
jgi:Fanconi anemia group M protein